MVQRFFSSVERRKALAIGYVIALVVIGIEAIRYVISLILDMFIFGSEFNKAVESYGYVVGLLIAVLILVYLIKGCDWE